MLPELSNAEMMRYNRQIVLRGFDFDGQEKLKASRVLVVGLGGLGCAAAQYLAAAGVGHLTLLDFDRVSLSNLQRQILHRDDRIGMSKVASARLTLEQINPHLSITTLDRQLDDQPLAVSIAEHDLVLDCTDNVAIREQLNRQCFYQKNHWFPAQQFVWKGKSAYLPMEMTNLATVASAVYSVERHLPALKPE